MDENIASFTFKDELKEIFEKATNFIKAEAGKLSSSQLLYFYGRFKQANEGPCSGSRPSFFNYQSRQKWDAWNALGNMSKEDAMKEYIDGVSSYDMEWEEKIDSGKVKKTAGMGVAVSTLKNANEDVEKSDDVKTIFDWCVDGNELKVAELLQKDRSCVNMSDDNGLTLLHWATDRGHASIVNLLLKQFAPDINAQDNEGQTPLHYAVSNEHVDIIQILLNNGAERNVKDSSGLSPLELNATSDILNIFASIPS